VIQAKLGAIGEPRDAVIFRPVVFDHVGTAAFDVDTENPMRAGDQCMHALRIVPVDGNSRYRQLADSFNRV
jgi:hypothetical protein